MSKKLSQKTIDKITLLHDRDNYLSNSDIAYVLNISTSVVYKYRPKVAIMLTCDNVSCSNTFERESNKRYCCDKCRDSYVTSWAPRPRRTREQKTVEQKYEEIISKANQKLKEIWK